MFARPQSCIADDQLNLKYYKGILNNLKLGGLQYLKVFKA